MRIAGKVPVSGFRYPGAAADLCNRIVAKPMDRPLPAKPLNPETAADVCGLTIAVNPVDRPLPARGALNPDWFD
jgi:hypothetical protein